VWWPDLVMTIKPCGITWGSPPWDLPVFDMRQGAENYLLLPLQGFLLKID